MPKKWILQRTCVSKDGTVSVETLVDKNGEPVLFDKRSAEMNAAFMEQDNQNEAFSVVRIK